MNSYQITCSVEGSILGTYRHQGCCPNGHPLDLAFDAKFDPDKIDNQVHGLWRYRHAFPIEAHTMPVTVDEGFTPLLPFFFDEKKVFIKQDQLFSTGSYKDRGATVLITKAKESGVNQLIQDSSGNAGCAIAAYAALAKIPCTIYLPEHTSPSKMRQIEAYGAQIIRVAGDRTTTAQAAMKAASSAYYASHVFNPWFVQGTKTFAYEIAEQLNWKGPDAVVVPAGNGTLVLGCYIGFTDLLKAGVIQKLPKIIAVQAAHCAPLHHLFHEDNREMRIEETIAEGIAIPYPQRLSQMLDAVKLSGGNVVVVNEQEIIDEHRFCGKQGFYIEPTSAATIAGCRKYVTTSNDDLVVTLFSGHGLKK